MDGIALVLAHHCDWWSCPYSQLVPSIDVRSLPLRGILNRLDARLGPIEELDQYVAVTGLWCAPTTQPLAPQFLK